MTEKNRGFEKSNDVLGSAVLSSYKKHFLIFIVAPWIL